MKKIYALVALCFFSRNAFGQPLGVQIKPLAECDWDPQIYKDEKDCLVSLDVLKKVEGRLVSKDDIEGACLAGAYAIVMFHKRYDWKCKGINVDDDLNVWVQHDLDDLFHQNYSLPYVQSHLSEYLDSQNPSYNERESDRFMAYRNRIRRSIDEAEKKGLTNWLLQ